MMDYEGSYNAADFHNHVMGDVQYLAMRNATLLEDGSVDVDFANSARYIYFQHVDDFEYSANIKEGQTFVVACITDEMRSDYLKQRTSGTGVSVLKYMGETVLEKDPPFGFPHKRFEERYHSQVERLNGEPTLEFFHFSAVLANDVPCEYPDVIKWSIDIIQTDGEEKNRDEHLTFVFGLGE